MKIPEGKYLGTLCKRGHDWNGTGKSLRYLVKGIPHKGGCLVCMKIRRRNGPILRQYYTIIHIIDGIAHKRCRICGQMLPVNCFNKDNIAKCLTTHCYKCQYSKYLKKYNYNAIVNLTDSYIKGILIYIHKVNRGAITPEMIELQRTIIKIKRSVHKPKLKGEQHETDSRNN